MKMSKIIFYSICMVLVAFILYGHLWIMVKSLCGRGVVVRRSGYVRLIVSGDEIECPYWVIDKTVMPRYIADLHAFQIGTNSTTVVVYVGEHGHLYWFDGSNIGVTRCNLDTSLLLDRWLFLSEVALNQTYNVLHSMKGLQKATVVYKETADGVSYTLKYLDRKSLNELVVYIKARELTK